MWHCGIVAHNNNNNNKNEKWKHILVVNARVIDRHITTYSLRWDFPHCSVARKKKIYNPYFEALTASLAHKYVLHAKR